MVKAATRRSSGDRTSANKNFKRPFFGKADGIAMAAGSQWRVRLSKTSSAVWFAWALISLSGQFSRLLVQGTPSAIELVSYLRPGSYDQCVNLNSPLMPL